MKYEKTKVGITSEELVKQLGKAQYALIKADINPDVINSLIGSFFTNNELHNVENLIMTTELITHLYLAGKGSLFEGKLEVKDAMLMGIEALQEESK